MEQLPDKNMVGMNDVTHVLRNAGENAWALLHHLHKTIEIFCLQWYNIIENQESMTIYIIWFCVTSW